MVTAAIPYIVLEFGVWAAERWAALSIFTRLAILAGIAAVPGYRLAQLLRQLVFVRDQLSTAEITPEMLAQKDWPMSKAALQIGEIQKEYTPAVMRVADAFVTETFDSLYNLKDAWNELRIAKEGGVNIPDDLWATINAHFQAEGERLTKLTPEYQQHVAEVAAAEAVAVQQAAAEKALAEKALAEQAAVVQAKALADKALVEQAAAAEQAAAQAAAATQVAATQAATQASIDQAKYFSAEAYKSAAYNTELINYYGAKELTALDNMTVRQQTLGQALNSVRDQTAQQTTVIEKDIDKVGAKTDALAPDIIRTREQVDGINDFSLPLAGALGTGVLSMTGLNAILSTFAGTSAKAYHQGRINCVETTGLALLANLGKSILPMALPAAFMLSPALQDLGAGFAKKGWDILMGPLTRRAPIDPEEGPLVGLTALTDAALLGMAAHTTAIIAESSAPLKNMGLSYLAAFLADMGAFGRIAGGTIGVMTAVGLSTPMRYYANAQLRPTQLAERDVRALYSRGEITHEEALKWLSYHGYRDDYLPYLANADTRALSYFVLKNMANLGLGDDAFYRAELRRTEYSPKAQELLLEMYLGLGTEESKGANRGIVIKRFKEGMIDDAGFLWEMLLLGYTEEQANQYLLPAQLEAQYDDTLDVLYGYRDAVRAGNLTVEDYGVELQRLGIRSDKVAIYQFREDARNKVSKEKAAPAVYTTAEGKVRVATARERFRKHLITEAELQSQLVTLGMPDSYASAIVDNEVVGAATAIG